MGAVCFPSVENLMLKPSGLLTCNS